MTTSILYSTPIHTPTPGFKLSDMGRTVRYVVILISSTPLKYNPEHPTQSRCSLALHLDNYGFVTLEPEPGLAFGSIVEGIMIVKSSENATCLTANDAQLLSHGYLLKSFTVREILGYLL